jgi:type IV secretion system protein VirD4
MTRLMLASSMLLGGYCLAVVSYRFPSLAVAVGLAAAALLAKKATYYTSFGSARWGDSNDARRAGMIGGIGLGIGFIAGSKRKLESLLSLFRPEIDDARACEQFFGCLSREPTLHPVHLNRAVHSIICAPIGVGKSSAVAVCFLLASPESCVVLDVKAELFSLTSAKRREMGHKVVVLDPFRMVTEEPDTFNPLTLIDPEHHLALDDCRDIASALVVKTGKEIDPHWNASSEIWIAAMTAATVAMTSEENKSLQSVREFLTNADKMTTVIRALCASENMMLSRMGWQLSQFADRELNSVLTTSNRHTAFLDTPAVYDSTVASSFDPRGLLDGKMTIYLILPPDRMRSQMGLMRLWISALFRVVVRGGLNPKHKVNFILDEAASLGHMEMLDDAVDKYRGYGVRLVLFYQSLGQLKKCWPDGQDQTLLSNTTQVFFGVNDKLTADYVSARLGKETIVVDSGGQSTGTSGQHGGQGSGGTTHSTNRNSNWQQVARELARPEEVAAFDERVAITFAPGVPPLMTLLVRYYEKVKGRNSSPEQDFLTALLMLVVAGFIAMAMTLALRGEKFSDVWRWIN